MCPLDLYWYLVHQLRGSEPDDFWYHKLHQLQERDRHRTAARGQVPWMDPIAPDRSSMPARHALLTACDIPYAGRSSASGAALPSIRPAHTIAQSEFPGWRAGGMYPPYI